eukprot:COSAG05_NODE_101_length_19100_cov_24.260144_2_plen_88_part_00
MYGCAYHSCVRVCACARNMVRVCARHACSQKRAISAQASAPLAAARRHQLYVHVICGALPPALLPVRIRAATRTISAAWSPCAASAA